MHLTGKDDDSLTQLKQEITDRVDRYKNELIELSDRIHDNPEIAFNEEKAHLWLTDYLKGQSFEIEKGSSCLKTAFKAIYGEGKPVIALLAEYDALPELGHACGHNIIAGAAVGAGIASKIAVDVYGGAVAVIGTPAEELFAGKATMVNEGAFDGVDAALIVHPASRNISTIESLACISLHIEFHGRSAHAAAHPEQGINALDAMILAFNSISALRQHIVDKARIHGIIIKGGEAANIVPEYTEAEFIVRAPDRNYLEELMPRVLDCFTGAATATGAELKYKWAEFAYDAMNNNRTLERLFAENLRSLGREVSAYGENCSLGSTDTGNVSQVVPAIHPSIAIVSPGISIHTHEFARAAASESGHAGLIDAAKAMAMTVADLLGNPEALDCVKSEFAGDGKARMDKSYREVAG